MQVEGEFVSESGMEGWGWSKYLSLIFRTFLNLLLVYFLGP